MDKYTVKELRKMAECKNIRGKSKMRKQELINSILQIKTVKNKEEIFNDIIDDLTGDINNYIKIRQLGKKGKEGTAFLVVNINTNKKYAMKTFKKRKSSKTLFQEIKFQHIASKENISPKIYDYNLDEKWFVMDLMDRTLLDVLEEQKSILTLDQQHQILNLFDKLDNIGIVHNDANPLNFMEKNGKFYLIDFGFAKNKNHSSFSNIGDTPNRKIMPVGLVIWLKKFNIDYSKWTYFISQFEEEYVKKFDI